MPILPAQVAKRPERFVPGNSDSSSDAPALASPVRFHKSCLGSLASLLSRSSCGLSSIISRLMGRLCRARCYLLNIIQPLRPLHVTPSSHNKTSRFTRSHLECRIYTQGVLTPQMQARDLRLVLRNLPRILHADELVCCGSARSVCCLYAGRRICRGCR